MAALESIIADGTYSEILETWGFPEAAVTQVKVSGTR